MRKRAQIAGQIFIYLLGIVLIGFLLIYGYKAIQGIQERSNQAAFLKFKADVQADAESSMEFGTVKRQSYMLSEHFTEVCFLDLKASAHENIEKYPLIKNSLEAGVEKNVFVIGQELEDSFYAGKIKAKNGFLCISVAAGRLDVQFEGKGDHTLVS